MKFWNRSCLVDHSKLGGGMSGQREIHVKTLSSVHDRTDARQDGGDGANHLTTALGVELAGSPVVSRPRLAADRYHRPRRSAFPTGRLVPLVLRDYHRTR